MIRVKFTAMCYNDFLSENGDDMKVIPNHCGQDEHNDGDCGHRPIYWLPTGTLVGKNPVGDDEQHRICT